MDEHKSTLERGDEIEADFYYLKSIEWAVSRSTAKTLIEGKMAELSDAIKQLRNYLDDNRV